MEVAQLSGAVMKEEQPERWVFEGMKALAEGIKWGCFWIGFGYVISRRRSGYLRENLTHDHRSVT